MFSGAVTCNSSRDVFVSSLFLFYYKCGSSYFVQHQSLTKTVACTILHHFITSFLPKSPPGFMVATRRKFAAAFISSTSPRSPLPFSASTRDFSVSRTLVANKHTKVKACAVFLKLNVGKFTLRGTFHIPKSQFCSFPYLDD